MDDAEQVLAALPANARELARERGLMKDELLFARGDPPRAMYCVLSGEVRLARISRTGTEIVFQRSRRGFLAEASLDQAAYHCDGAACVPSRLLSIPRAAFREALADASFRDAWLGHLGRELRRVRAQSERAGLRTARERIVHYIESEGRDARLTLSGSKKAWAAELGLTHEALYRALRSMVEQRELSSLGSSFHLLDTE